MKIAAFTESGYTGEVQRDNKNMRTDLAWWCTLGAIHHPIGHLPSMKDNEYDIGIMILPKNRKQLINLPILEEYKRVCKKVTIMQESYYNYWQDSSIEEQIWYFNFITEMDLIFCHNDVDLIYYNGLTNVRTELLPSVMITDGINKRDSKGNGVIIGGNFVWAYGGFDSYQVALEITDDVTAVTTGRMKPEEEGVLKHIPWVLWRDWINILSQFSVGVQLGTASAGTFNLNCSFHGIPCVGYSNVNTQKVLHPSTTVEVGDIGGAREIARKLKDDKFYDFCVEETLDNFKNYYSEKRFIEQTTKIIKSL